MFSQLQDKKIFQFSDYASWLKCFCIVLVAENLEFVPQLHRKKIYSVAIERRDEFSMRWVDESDITIPLVFKPLGRIVYQLCKLFRKFLLLVYFDIHRSLIR